MTARARGEASEARNTPAAPAHAPSTTDEPADEGLAAARRVLTQEADALVRALNKQLQRTREPIKRIRLSWPESPAAW